MRRLTRLSAPFAAVLALVLAAAAARADVLELRTGELVPGRAESMDDEGVSWVPEKGGALRVAWDRVVPRCRYDLMRSALAADDADGRVRLAKWALAAGLYRSARRDLGEARGLGYAGADDLDALLAAVRKAEADDTLDDVDEITGAGRPADALEKVKAYLRAAEPGPDADRVRARVADLVERIERQEADARAAEEERKAAEKDGRIKEWVDRNMRAADQAKEAAGAAAAEGFGWIAKGNQSRARAALTSAESKYRAARDGYAKVRKAVRQGDVADECAERMKDCDSRTVQVLVRWGRLEVGNKSWKQASAIVDRGLRVDPVQRELLELRAEIDRNWIRRKLSDTTNARGHASSN